MLHIGLMPKKNLGPTFTNKQVQDLQTCINVLEANQDSGIAPVGEEVSKMLNWYVNEFKTFEDKKKNFEALFHAGVVFQHKGSNIKWTVQSTFTNFHTHERRCKIKSEKGYTKELNRDQVNHFEVIEIPEAVKVLFAK